MAKTFIKFVASAGFAAAIGFGVVHGVNAHDRQTKAEVATVVVADEARAEVPDTGTKWPLPMLTPSI